MTAGDQPAAALTAAADHARQTLYEPLAKALTWHGARPTILCYYFELANAVVLANHKLGIAIVPSGIHHMVKSADYITKDIPALELKTYYVAIKRKGDDQSEAVRQFWSLLQKYRFQF